MRYDACLPNGVSADRDNRSRLVRTRSLAGVFCCLLTLVIEFDWKPNACYGDDALLEEIRSQAYFHVSAIRTIQFTFESTDSKGWRCQSEFYGDGNRFRVNRQDSAGIMLGDQRSEPASFAVAYNGDRYQYRHDSEKLLRLEDGNANAGYTIDIPQMTVYGWLSMPGQKLRWDTILDSERWSRRFETASYTGQVVEDNRVFETVDFPQREGVRTPCIFKVYFAEDLQYFPLKWVRRVEETGENASTVDVTRFKQVDLDGATIVLPLELQVAITGADKMALARTETASISEESIVLNEDIAASVFNIDLPPGYEEYDMDKLNSNVIPGENLAETSGSSGRLRWMLWLNLGLITVVVVYFTFKRFRQRSV